MELDKVRDALRAKDTFFEKMVKTLLKRLPALDKRLNEAINATLDKLSDKGNLATKGLTKALNELDALVTEALVDSGYAKATQKFTRDFELIEKYNADIHKLVNSIDITKKNFNPIFVSTAELTVQKMLEDGLNVAFTEGVKTAIITNATAGGSIKEARKSIADGLKATDGSPRLNKYIETTARDAIFQVDGAINAQVSELYGLTDFIYAGSLLPPEKGATGKPLKGTGSRPQCVRWVRMGKIKGTELPKEIAWANGNGRGMIAGTTPSNFAVNRGGWGCRHQAIPVSPELEVDLPEKGLIY